MSVHPPVPVQLRVHNGVQFVLHLSSGNMFGITDNAQFGLMDIMEVLKSWRLIQKVFLYFLRLIKATSMFEAQNLCEQ